MAIYQPTNITPDLISGPENGVVFTNPGGYVDVSWAVNGNSPMTAYQIEFFQNDAASTPGTNTGKITLAQPFSAIDAQGNEQRFSVSLPFGVNDPVNPTYFAIAYADPNRQGKIRITQWWGSGAGQSVVQRSLSVFRIAPRSAVSVSGPTLVNGNRTFSASVSLPSVIIFGESAVEWCEWQIFEVDPFVPDSDVLIQDTEQVWGATSYDWTAAPLTPGTYYAKFTCYTSNGETLTASTANFTVLENAVTVTGGIEAFCDTERSAVGVTVSGDKNIPGTVSGAIITPEGGLSFESGGGAAWKFQNLPSGNWGFVWTGKMEQFGDEVFNLTQNGASSVNFGFSSGQAGESAVLDPYANIQEPQDFEAQNVVLIAFLYTGSGTAKWIIGAWSGGNYSYTEGSVSFTQATPTSVYLQYGAETRSFRLCFGPDGIDAVQYFAQHGQWQTAEETYPSIALDPANAALNFVYPIGLGNIWRGSESGGALQYIGSVGDGIGGTFYDYSAVNLKTPDAYTYYIIQDDGNGGGTVIRSNAVTPCLWDWVLIEAIGGKMGSGVVSYTPVNVFKFSLNISTGGNGNGNSPNVQPTFTPYPAVLRDTQNRQSGVLTGLIGYASAPGKYTDSNGLRDAIRALSVSKYPLFLRSRRGDFLRIAISGEITTTINDNSAEQEVTVSIPWVEVGPVDGAVATGVGSK